MFRTRNDNGIKLVRATLDSCYYVRACWPGPRCRCFLVSRSARVLKHRRSTTTPSFSVARCCSLSRSVWAVRNIGTATQRPLFHFAREGPPLLFRRPLHAEYLVRKDAMHSTAALAVNFQYNPKHAGRHSVDVYLEPTVQSTISKR